MKSSQYTSEAKPDFTAIYLDYSLRAGTFHPWELSAEVVTVFLPCSGDVRTCRM